ncbi:glycoside hydrolase family protein [Asticcacaulis biprosthecium C19]|uniref:Glycoside hydrolase family protein n=1 Tax=Asticcacaulis biprosthecium C19 TaxID=715226 RepID=F4QPZ2_9CAUL|nr:cellulase N-terminal Ig-like domain-containing protein [Asticcacaulis biprosthecium]EGF90279.1 glycoside hydrolase family protein [Asticcacaulis biprosthecium C19]
MRIPVLMSALCALVCAAPAIAGPLKLNDKGYFETRGVNVMVFSNWYDGLFSDAKISGVEIIHQGVRTATNGDVRLMPTPGQWDEIGQMSDRKFDPATGIIETTLTYPAYDFTYVMRAVPKGEGVEITINLDKPLPAALEGRAGFNLEFLPAAYFRKSYMADNKAGSFPLYPSGPMKTLADGKTEPLPLASGRSFVLAPEDATRRVTVTSADPINLYDGRNQAQNGWYVLRGLIPAGKTGAVISWTVTPNSDPNWVRPAMIAHSQLGYAPQGRKVAVIELDRNDTSPASARLLEVSADGATTPVLTADAKPWGQYLRYDYRTFDFSSVTKPGLYMIEYGSQRTATFRIDPAIYAEAWQPTLEVFMPVQMDHMFVNEAYRVWHGDPHRDDALQAPLNQDHIDLYASKDTTDTRFKPFEHIPGLNVGGWLDAGDFDIRTQTNYGVVRNLVETWELFGIDRDQTTIDQDRRYVDIHVPDGQADMLQQIRHGAIQLIAQFDSVGHAINGIVEPDVAQYTHLGDAVTKTDGLIYDPSLKAGEVVGNRSGTRDDRWAFTNKSSSLNYGSIAALAASSRALRGFDDPLADKALGIATRVWDEEQSHPPIIFQHGNTTGGPILNEELTAAVELLITTKDPKYAKRIEALWPQVEKAFPPNADLIAKVIPYMPKGFKARVRPAVIAYAAEVKKMSTANPFGVPITEAGWAGSGRVIDFGLTNAWLNSQFPDVIGTESVFAALEFLHGTHPGSNVSFVSGIGTVSKEVAYGANRADFSFIAGGVVPGVLILKPDFPENKEDWPFLWGENEYVISQAPIYIQLVHRARALSEGVK